MVSVTVNTGESEILTKSATGSDCFPSISGDGLKLVFARRFSLGNSDIYLLDLSEANTKQNEPTKLYTWKQDVFGFAWNEDAEEVIFSGGHYSNPQLWRINTSRAVEPTVVPLTDSGVLQPAISQNGDRLAYTSARTVRNIWHVRLCAERFADGPPEQLIASTRNDASARYSPDGKKIAFHSVHSGNDEIWVCDTDGSNPVQLSSIGGARGGSPAWSPDSRLIAYDSRESGQSEIYVMEVQGGAPKQLTHHPAADTMPYWSSDGAWIYFHSSRSEQGVQVWKIPTRGGEAVQVTRKEGRWPQESLDRQFLYYFKSEGGVNSIWKVPLAGGDEEPCLTSQAVGGQLVVPAFYIVDETGIYHAVQRERGFCIQFYDFESERVKEIICVDKPSGWGLSVSPDGRSLLWSQVDYSSGDLMLVENFR